MRPSLLHLTLGLFLVAACPRVAAGGYYFDSWTTENGLPQNSIDAILQTRDGYLWIATADGLVRYDGAQFKVFNRGNTPGISDNRCKHMLEDRAGVLWIQNQFGLMSYHDGEFHSYTADDGMPEKMSQFFEAKGGGLIFVSNTGLTHWRDGRSSPIPNEGGNPTSSFGYQDKSGAIWFNTATSLVQLTADGKSILHAVPHRYAGEWARRAYEDSHGNFWLGTTTGLYRIVGEDKITPFYVKGWPEPSQISCISEDGQGRLLVATEPAGLFQITLNSAAAADAEATAIAFNPPGAPAANYIDCMFRDRENTMWVGTAYYGLLRAHTQVVTVYNTKNGLSCDNIYPVYEDRQGAVWVGGWRGPLTRYKDGKFTYYGLDWLSTAFAEDREGGLWVGRVVGLNRFDGETFTDGESIVGLSRPYEVDSIHQDRQGNMWFGTNEGIVKYRNGVRSYYTTTDGLAGKGVKAILEDRQGVLWFGSYGGLTRLKDGVFTSYRMGDGLASDHVRSLYEDADGVLWIGTYDGGLSRLKDGRFTTYTTNDGLFNNGVFQILDDQRGNFWMSSNLGIYRTSRQELNDFAEGKIHTITCVSYGKRDGMLNAECNGGTQPAGVRTRDGRLWFPTQIGVAVIDPAAVPFNSETPPVLIEDIIIDGAPARTRAGFLRIVPGQESFEIHYTGLSFVNPEHVRFRYRMEGLDKDWVEAGTRRAAFYSHVPPGSYRFNVVAANADGVWNMVGASINVTVVPPFWRTWWFSLVILSGLAGLAVFLYRRRVSMLKRATAAQEAFSRQLIESQENERKRIAAELHDSLGQSLSIIANRANFALSKCEDPGRVLDQVVDISATASDAIREVREIAYNLRPVELDRLGLTKALRAMLKKISTSTGINILGDIDDIDTVFSSESEINLYRIVQESINNIVKHSGATEAAVEIKRLPAAVSIAIRDNGKGFQPAAGSPVDGRPAGFGLMGIAERARMLGGKQVIQSTPGQGTTISIQIDHRKNGN
jgi:signal transduction histidine kinase/ligand-binding sensor domain-containing protein